MHHCECDHRRLSYCGKCRLVHCLACKQEWTHQVCTKPHWSWPPYYWTYSSQQLPGTYSISGAATTGNLQTSNGTLTDALGSVPLATTCEHDGV